MRGDRWELASQWGKLIHTRHDLWCCCRKELRSDFVDATSMTGLYQPLNAISARDLDLLTERGELNANLV